VGNLISSREKKTAKRRGERGWLLARGTCEFLRRKEKRGA